MAITTINSISVNARGVFGRDRLNMRYLLALRTLHSVAPKPVDTGHTRR
jgi:hypothetical protein